MQEHERSSCVIKGSPQRAPVCLKTTPLTSACLYFYSDKRFIIAALIGGGDPKEIN
jgi:hypothetical protein